MVEMRLTYNELLNKLQELEKSNASLSHELKNLKESILEKQRFTNTIASETPDVIYIFEIASNRNIYINKNLREVLNYPYGAVPEDSTELVNLVIHPDDVSKFLNYNDLVKSWDHEYIYEYEYRLKDASGNWRWFLGKEREFERRNDKIISIIGITNDITEWKNSEFELIKAKEEAEKSNQLKTAFLQNISHEIRTPMNAICGFSDLLLEPDLPKERQDDYISIIQNSSNQLLAIVNDILTISALETNQEKINIQSINLNSLLSDIYTIFLGEANKQNVDLKLANELTSNLSEIKTDKTKITQIISNLITNALKFTHKGFIEFGYRIKHSEANHTILLYVKDTGIGIATENHTKIFERFLQANNTIAANYGGTGLGLAISQGFAQLLDGKIWVESELGNGATFYCEIPYIPSTTYDIKKHQKNS